MQRLKLRYVTHRAKLVFVCIFFPSTDNAIFSWDSSVINYIFLSMLHLYTSACKYGSVLRSPLGEECHYWRCHS